MIFRCQRTARNRHSAAFPPDSLQQPAKEEENLTTEEEEEAEAEEAEEAVGTCAAIPIGGTALAGRLA